MPACEIDLRPNGTWRYVWRKAGGQEMAMHGKYLEIDPPGRLVTTEAWGGDWPDTVNTLELSESDGHTKVKLTVKYPSKKAREAAVATGMKDGMDPTFARLDALLKPKS
jgi:uncharacterized protein YndB with AHSA1/START domain